MRAVNSRNQSVLASQVEVANSLLTRLRGLMGRKTLPEGQGMLIKRSGNSIHTFFMNFSIDLIFIDKKGEVRWLSSDVKPGRMIFAPLMARTDCLELPAGVIEKTKTQVGDVIRVES